MNQKLFIPTVDCIKSVMDIQRRIGVELLNTPQKPARAATCQNCGGAGCVWCGGTGQTVKEA